MLVWSLIRLPLLAMIAAILAYWAAAEAVSVDRHLGLSGPDVVAYELSDTSDDTGRALPTDLWPSVVAALPAHGARAAYLPHDEVQVGVGIYDPERRWPGLPFEPDEYEGATRTVSVRANSALSALRGHAQVATHAHHLAREFPDGGSPPWVDFVYPLGSARGGDGLLLLEGVDDAGVQAVRAVLEDAGVVAQMQPHHPLPLQVARSRSRWRWPSFWPVGGSARRVRGCRGFVSLRRTCGHPFVWAPRGCEPVVAPLRSPRGRGCSRPGSCP